MPECSLFCPNCLTSPTSPTNPTNPTNPTWQLCPIHLSPQTTRLLVYLSTRLLVNSSTRLLVNYSIPSILRIHGAISTCRIDSCRSGDMPGPKAMSVVASCPLRKPWVPPFCCPTTSPVRLFVTDTPTTGSNARTTAGSAPFISNSSFSTTRKSCRSSMGRLSIMRRMRFNVFLS